MEFLSVCVSDISCLCNIFGCIFLVFCFLCCIGGGVVSYTCDCFKIIQIFYIRRIYSNDCVALLQQLFV